jgi:hypothetical protein
LNGSNSERRAGISRVTHHWSHSLASQRLCSFDRSKKELPLTDNYVVVPWRDVWNCNRDLACTNVEVLGKGIVYRIEVSTEFM